MQGTISNGAVSLINATFNDNSAGSNGGAIYNESGNISLRNSILYGNPGGEIFGTADATYSIVQGGYTGIGNLNADPLIGLLQDNGGFTQTMALLPGSPAIDAGEDTNCPATDQRGVTRPFGSHCDIGAYEYLGATTFSSISKWTSSFDLSHGWTVADFVRTVGDVNGDGKDDLIGFGLDGVYVATSNGTGFNAISKWTSSFDLSHGWTVADFVRTVGDVNGDGKDDLVGLGLEGV